MWADTLLRAERLHLVVVMAWSAASVIAGTGALLVLSLSKSASALLRGFALTCIGCGVLELALAALAYRELPLRNLSAAVRLDRTVWFELGFFSASTAAGGAFALVSWRVSKRLGGIGVGVAVALQGLALAILDMRFATVISR